MAHLEEKNLLVSRNDKKNGTLPRVPFLAIKEKILGKDYYLSISFVEEKVAQTINKEHRKKDYVPNTLSFSLSNTSGEIIMCLPAIKKEYKKFGMSLEKYLIFLTLHSMLHLKGYQHGSTMEDKEQYYLAFFTKE